MSCWSGGFTPEICCPLSFGPEGNPECWDGISFTYKRCCPTRHLCWNGEFTPEVCCNDHGGNSACWDGMYFTFEKCCPRPFFSCVPTESYVALACVLPAILVLLLCTLVCERRRSPVHDLEAITKSHSAFLDNARFLSLVLVIWAHVANTHVWYFAGPKSALIKFLRFHMPTMCFISGTLSQGELTNKRLSGMVARLAAPLILFVLFLLPFVRLVILPALLRKEFLEPAWTVTHFYGDILSRVFMIGHWDIGWYIRCLLCWRLATSLLNLFSITSQIIIALLIGISSAYTYLDGADTTNLVPIRCASLFPYFCFGKLFGHRILRNLRPHDSLVRLMLGWTVLLGSLVYALHSESSLDRVILHVEVYPHEFVSLRRLLTLECDADLAFLWARYCAALMLRGGMSLFFLCACVPRQQSWFTVYGTYTMYPYLLHLEAIPFLYRLLANYVSGSPRHWVNACIQGMRLRSGFSDCCVAAAWFFAALFITVALSSRPCRFILGVLIEPNWVCCNSELKRTKED